MKSAVCVTMTCLAAALAGCGNLGGGFHPDYDALAGDGDADPVMDVVPDPDPDVPVDGPSDGPADVPEECPDDDGDGVCNDDDVCPGGDDTVDSDGDTIPDYCDCEGLTCGDNAHCEDSGDGPVCVCDDGYEGDGTTCTDIDECTLGTDTCDANATCTNTEGGYDCTCDAGYSGDGFSCSDDDECALGTDTCDTNATCTNTDGGYTCACNTGYSGDGFTCAPIDHCAGGTDTCDTNATCTYTGPGTYTCACNTGYSGDGFSCSPINHCSAGTDTCDTNATCTYTGPGTYTCACNSGYTGDGFTCTAIGGGCLDYDESFPASSLPETSAQCVDWNTFRAALPSSGLVEVTMTGSLDGTGGATCSTPSTVQAIANALRTATAGTWTCGGQTWRVGECGITTGFSWELSAGTSGVCTCDSGTHVMRPCIGNDNWGGMGTATCSAPAQDMSVSFCGDTGFCSCVGTWCAQTGTSVQYTRCESAADGCSTCINPEIRYGTTTGGIPNTHTGNRYDLWCQQLGFSDYLTGSVSLGTRSCTAPFGRVFGCTGYEESTWHWCDWSDGWWRDATLDLHTGCTGNSITSFTCVP